MLTRLVSALKPGGWLVDEEFDSVSLLPDPTVSPGEVILNTQMAVMRILKDRGAERRFGRFSMAGCGHMGLWKLERRGDCLCGGAGLQTSPSCERISSSFAELCLMPTILPSKNLIRTSRTWTIRISWRRPPSCGRRGDADHQRDATQFRTIRIQQPPQVRTTRPNFGLADVRQ